MKEQSTNALHDQIPFISHEQRILFIERQYQIQGIMMAEMSFTAETQRNIRDFISLDRRSCWN
jgi:hypothetical protein